MGCFSGRLMSAASDQKLFCELCSAFNCSFDEFVGEKVVSPSYSSAILAPPSLLFNMLSRLIFFTLKKWGRGLKLDSCLYNRKYDTCLLLLNTLALMQTWHWTSWNDFSVSQLSSSIQCLRLWRNIIQLNYHSWLTVKLARMCRTCFTLGDPLQLSGGSELHKWGQLSNVQSW